ncbi:ParA family protein [Scleromatobacter humisilvae]|uniref:ParA family protein n=1 Tax=Scleromatobacter humisilvae TaxID=2897159 RepID=A0A9X1YJL2_9BURK|nr:ParA family protein [Scleromatobacter humisilvae]MCK9687353.1 ParA family protein [Scleromatobacter humisilvae]
MNSTIRVITVASMKGGSGKSTVAQNLAVSLELAGHGPVVMADTDAPQGSLSAWWNRREAETPAMAELAGGLAELPTKLQALAAAGYRWCIIDTGPRDPFEDERPAIAIRVADLVVIPAKTSIKDLEAAAPTIRYATEQGKRFLFVLNEVKANTLMTPQAVAVLSEYGPVVPKFLGDRTLFQSADNDGRTAIELQPKGKAAEEVRGLMEFVLSRFPEFAKPMKEKVRA